MTVPLLVGTPSITVAALADRDDVLILGNALGTDVHLWDLALPTLEAKKAVLRWDLPGHGKSPAATGSFTIAEIATGVIALADEYGVDRFDYAGVSIGGAVGLELARLYPDRVKRLITVCTAPKSGTTEMWVERAAQVRAEGTASLVPGIPDRWFAPDFPARDPLTTEKVLAMVVATNDEDYAKLCVALGGFDAWATLGDITAPTLIIAGALDPIATSGAAQKTADGVTDGQCLIVEHTSHQAIVEKPLEVARAIADFLA
ncbi:MAG: hypothetical protein RIR88_800 [Actinomycetota bacterium]